MILHSIEVRSWRNLLGPIAAGPLSEQVNIIHGPNGTGKSTLFEALRFALFNSHRLVGRSVEAIRPWGRDLAPQVTVEFTHGGATYRLTKQFLREPFAQLERLESGGFRPFKEGRAADDLVRSLFSGIAPGRGPAKLEHYGFFQVLWAPQGSIELSGLSPRVVSAVQESLGVEITSAAGSPIEQEIERRYLSIFTSKGRYKKGKAAAEIPRLQEQAGRLEGERSRLLRLYEEAKTASRRIEDLKAQRAQAIRDAEALRAELRRAEARLRRFEELKSKMERARAQVEAAKQRHNSLANKIRQIKVAWGEAQEYKAKIADTKATIEAAEKEAALRTKDLEVKEADLRKIREQQKSIDNMREELKLAARLQEAQAEAEELATRIEQAERLIQSIERLKQKRADLVAPDAQAMRKIRSAARKYEELSIRLDDALIHLEITPDRPVDIQVLKAEQTGRISAQPGETLEIPGAPEVVVQVPGVGNIRARGPVGDTAKLKRLLASARGRLEDLTRPYGTQDLEELQDLREKATVLEKELGKLEGRLQSVLGAEDLEALKARASEAEAVVRNILRTHREWKTSPPDPDEMSVEIEKLSRAQKTREETASAAVRHAERAVRKVKEKIESSRARLAEMEEALRRAESRLAELRSDGKTEAQREEELNSLALEWRASRAPLEEIEAELKHFGAQPQDDVEMLKRRLAAAEEAEDKARDEVKTAEGRLAQLSQEDIYGRLAVCEEHLAETHRRLAAATRRADAIRLLRETISALRSETTAGIAKPLAATASKILQRIAGPGISSIKLGSDLAPQGVRPLASESLVEPGQLSGGEVEQLHLACRLALAEVLARGERQLLVLDDALTATDTARFSRVLTVLEEMKNRLQIVVLTCHPERYVAIEGAKTFDLEEAIAATAAAR